MLDMFKRPTDPAEHNYLYALPTATIVAGCFAGYYAGYVEVVHMAYLASSALCIAAIGCLADMKTARLGNTLGIMGVAVGVAATVCIMSPTGALAAQMAGSIGAGLLLGYGVARSMKITELPQMVAALLAGALLH